jgi:WD40 repeat protein
VRIWDAATGAPVGDPLPGDTGPVNAVAVGRIGNRDVIVAGGGDDSVRIWDAVSGQCKTILVLLGSPTACALAAPNLLCVAVGASVCTFRMVPHLLERV